jgi:hypothetical protein
MSRLSVFISALAVLLVCSGCDLSDGDEGTRIDTSLSFTGIQQLDINTVSGNCTLQPADDETLRVDLSYTFPESCFEPLYTKEEDVLELEEDFFGGSCSGSSEWQITVPDGIDIEFSSASGHFTLTDHQADLSVSTASGHIEVGLYEGQTYLSTASGHVTLENVSGTIEASSASGRVAATDGSGMLDLTSASGDVRCEGVVFTAASSFTSASGDVAVVVTESPDYDMHLSSASSQAVLNYNGHEVQGYFEFTARQDNGTIISPYPFDSETTFTQGDYIYDRKSFTRGQGTPSITIGTASGTAKLRLN